MNPEMIRANRFLAVGKILFGVTNDAPGLVIGPDGKPHPVPGWDPTAYFETLTPETRDTLISFAVNELAVLIENKDLRSELQRVATEGIKKEATKITPAGYLAHKKAA